MLLKGNSRYNSTMNSILTGWGRTPIGSANSMFPTELGQIPSLTVNPYLPRGLGRSYGDASLPASGHVAVHTHNLNRMLSFNPSSGVLDAEAGVSLDAILAVSVPRGFFLPVTPGTVHVTLGGALASNVHGKNHHRVGSIENFVLEMEVLTGLGNKICSSQILPDLFYATLGGYGLTGLILRAKLKLKPIQNENVEVMRMRTPNLQSMFEGFKKHDSQFEYSVAWIDSLSQGKEMGRGVLMFGNHSPNRPSEKAENQNIRKRGRFKPRIPFALPQIFLNRIFLRFFNALFFALAPSQEKKSFEKYQPYFYPLDKIENWNLLYGAKGFFQYQCMIPDPHSEEGISKCLHFLSEHGLGSFLSVLKRCGDDTVLLPFCKRGYTLALDIPNRGNRTLKLLDKLDEIVLQFQGRVYLTKDARLSAASFKTMYPEFTDWMQVIRKYNPSAHTNSQLAERLQFWK